MKQTERNTANGRDVPCGVIKDLLVLYEDEVCSKESSDIIKEHIEDCESCRKVYEQVSEPFPQINMEQEPKMYLDDLFIQAVKNYGKRITARHIMMLGVVLLMIAVVHYILTGPLMLVFNAVPSGDIRITELYQLAGGDIYCTIKLPKPVLWPNLRSMEVPEEDCHNDSSRGFYELNFQYPLYMNEKKYLYRDTFSIIFPARSVNGYGISDDMKDTYIHTCDSIYYRGRSKNDRLEIWKRGQSIEAAPSEIEQKAIQTYTYGGDVEKALKEMEEIGEEISGDEIAEYYSDYYSSLADSDFPYVVPE